MAIIKGWLDDSEKNGVLALGGYVGAEHRWETFDTAWPMALANHDVPYFHMREMASPTGVFGKWHPHAEHRAEVKDFFGGLTRAVTQSRLVGFCSIVRCSDLERFNAEFGQRLEAYPLAAYGCMLLVARDEPTLSAELVFDHCDKIDSRLVIARQYAESDSYYAGYFDRLVTVPLPKGVTWREIPALQAADFLAWEIRKGHETINDWFNQPDRPDDRDAQWDHFIQWSTRTFGTLLPKMRGSANALFDNRDFQVLVWDYDKLCESHRRRSGRWVSG